LGAEAPRLTSGSGVWLRGLGNTILDSPSILSLHWCPMGREAQKEGTNQRNSIFAWIGSMLVVAGDNGRMVVQPRKKKHVKKGWY